jgi:hypothetical protein
MSASKFFTAAMIRVFGHELEYCIDVCGVTRVAQIEHLWLSKKPFFSFPVVVNKSIKVGALGFWL